MREWFEAKNWKDFLTIFTAGMFIRLVALYIYPDPHFPDASSYFATGESLFKVGQMSFVQYMPLYPILSYLTGNGFWLQVLDSFFSTASAVLIYSISFSWFRNLKMARIAALIWCLYPYAVFYSIVRLTESSFIFFLLLAFWALDRKNVLVGCVAIVLSILIRPTIDLLAPFLIVAFAITVHKLPRMQIVKWVSIYVSVYVLLMSPWWYHNFQKYGHWVRLNLGDGIVFYSGNNPMNHSGGGIFGKGPSADVDTSEFDSIPHAFYRNQAMKEAALEYIWNNPLNFMKMMGVKFCRFWRIWPYTPYFSSVVYQLVSVLSFGPILLGSIFFVIRYGETYKKRLFPAYMLIFYLTVVHMVTISSIRYRFPLEPFLVIFATGWLFSWSERKFGRPFIG